MFSRLYSNDTRNVSRYTHTFHEILEWDDREKARGRARRKDVSDLIGFHFAFESEKK